MIVAKRKRYNNPLVKHTSKYTSKNLIGETLPAAPGQEAEAVQDMIRPLLKWYAANKRSLPWREDPSPYHVWVSEIMLQQTRVEAVRRYYARFLQELPTIEALACVAEERLLKLWEGLGYYNRARNMQKAAQMVMADYGGEMPARYDEILRLPGIGAYTAGAIASIAFGEHVAAVDGNVLRVLARYLADATDIASEALKARRKQELEDAMRRYGRRSVAGTLNQSLMDLGAMVCLPGSASKCPECPLSKSCRAYQEGKVAQLPYKSPKAKRKIADKTVFVIQYQDRVLLHKRDAKGLLAGLYELPSAEGHLEKDAALDYVESLGFHPIHIEPLPESRHVFTHLEWRMRGYLIRADELYEPYEPHASLESHGPHAPHASPESHEPHAAHASPESHGPHASHASPESHGPHASTAEARQQPLMHAVRGYRLETPAAIEAQYPIPSAFAAYAPYIRQKMVAGEEPHP